MEEKTTDTGIGSSIAAAQKVLGTIQGASQIASLIVAAVGNIEVQKAAAVSAIEQSKNESLAAIRAASRESPDWREELHRPPSHRGEFE